MQTNHPTEPGPTKGKAARPPMSPAKKGLLIAIAAILVLSVIARATLGGGEEQKAGAQSATPSGADSLLPGGAQQPPGQAEPAPEPEGLEKALPYITEGSFFAMIGFALGYASKKFLKLGMLVVAAFFVGLQLLSYSGVVAIDWQRAVALLNDFVLNIKEGETFTEVLTARLPSAGALLAAFFVGFRSG